MKTRNRLGSRRAHVVGGWTVSLFAVLAAIRLIVAAFSEPDRSTRNLLIFLTMTAAFVVALYLFELFFFLLVWRGVVQVRKNNPESIVFPAFVQGNFIQTANQSGYLTTGKHMPPGLARPTVSFDQKGMIVWFGHRQPIRGLLIPSSHIYGIDPVPRDNREFGGPSLHARFGTSTGEVSLRFRVTRMTVFGLIIVRNDETLKELASEIGEVIGSTSPDAEAYDKAN